MKCHGDEKMMRRNGVFTVSVRTYENSYHGKNYRLGFPEGGRLRRLSHVPFSIAGRRPRFNRQFRKSCPTCHKCHHNATRCLRNSTPMPILRTGRHIRYCSGHWSP
jgi:hypothetical protein